MFLFFYENITKKIKSKKKTLKFHKMSIEKKINKFWPPKKKHSKKNIAKS